MRKEPMFMMLALLLPLSAASPLEASYIDNNIQLSNIIEIEPTSPSYKVDQVTASLSWVPADTYRQQVKSLGTDPFSTPKDDELEFRWVYPRENELWIKLSSSTRTTSEYKQVKDTVSFPITEVEGGLSRYLKEEEIIDISESIRGRAADLAEGKNDLYEVVVDIAAWVNQNINYSLDTLTAEASQKSSWVLENRKGVCDEITSLFISMLRALGVPARFVYGEAYTNTGTSMNDWGPHGWAEVWFPGYGWVPFDPTYGEYGHVDAGHVKMGHSEDARRPSLKYSMTARNANVKSGFLDVKIIPVAEGGEFDHGIALETKMYAKETGLSSYNLVTASVRNNDEYYKPVVLKLAAPKEVRIKEPEKVILLRPGEQEDVKWLLKLDGLDPGFSYTFPVKVKAGNLEEEARFMARGGKKDYARSTFEPLLAEGKKLPHSKDVLIDCSPEKDIISLEEEARIGCTVKNQGDRILEGSVCQESCIDISLEPGTEEKFTFTRNIETIGVKNMAVTALGKGFSRTSYSRLEVIDDANISIEVTAPGSVKYGDTAEIRIRLEEASYSTPINVTTKISVRGSSRKWELERLEGPAIYDVSLDTSGFGFNNNVVIEVEFSDELGQKYYVQEEQAISMEDLNPITWTLAALNTIGYKILGFLT